MASNSGSKQIPQKFLTAIENNKLKDQLKEKDRKIERMKAEINELRSQLSKLQG